MTKSARQTTIPMLLIMITLAMSGCAKLLVESDTSNLLTSVAQNEGSLETLYGIGRLSERNGNTEKAIEVYEAILEQHPSHTNALHRMGIVNAKRGMLDAAHKLLKQASESETPSGELLGDIGYVYYLQGNLSAAESALTEAIEKSPEDPRILNNLGIVAGAKQQYAKSMDLFRRSSSEAEALASVAFLQSQTGQVDAAKTNFLRSLELDSKLDTAANGLISLQKNASTREPDQRENLETHKAPIQLASYEAPIETTPSAPTLSLPQIATRLRGPKRSWIGQPVEFELMIENRSAAAAESIIVQLTVSDRMDVTVLDRPASFDGENRIITWQLQSLAAKSTEVIKYSAVGQAAGSVVQSVSVKANGQPAGELELQTEIVLQTAR